MRPIVNFAPLFSKRVWEHAQVVVVKALLAPGKRTVSAVLRVVEFLPFCNVGPRYGNGENPAFGLRTPNRDLWLCRLIG
jgi:hypothetical protein